MKGNNMNTYESLINRETHEGFSTVIDAIHPVKELTDEEINIVGIKTLGSIWNCYEEELLDFARAILRKAKRNERI